MVPDPPPSLGSASPLCVIFLLLGISILGYAVYLAIPSIRLAVSGATADGRVIRNDDGIYPVVEFEANQQRIVLGGRGQDPPEFQEGEAVTVLYDRMHPEHAIIQSFGQMWTWQLILFAIGIFVATMSVFAALQKYGAMLLLVCIVPGVSVLSATVGDAVDTMHLAITGAKTDGTVTGLRDVDGQEYPVVAFKTANGQRVEFTGDGGKFREEQTVSVIYDRKHPQHASIRSFGQMWLGTLLACGAGLFFTAAPLLIAWTGLWSRLR